VIINGWLDWAVRVDGHPAKVYSQPNSGEGIACHSIVGDLPYHSIPSRFLSDERETGNPGRFSAMAAASVMFILYRDGQLTQMYPVTASTWTSGGFDGNTRFWAVEAEGGGPGNYAEPLTPAAESTFLRLVQEWERHTGNHAEPGVNILEHRQIAAKYGYAPTACASGRYAGAWARITAPQQEEEPMTPEERQMLRDIHAALTGGVPGVLEAWNANGNSMLAAYNEMVFPHMQDGAIHHQLEPRVVTIPVGTRFTAEVQE
jgi:hypothetical protein